MAAPETQSVRQAPCGAGRATARSRRTRVTSPVAACVSTSPATVGKRKAEPWTAPSVPTIAGPKAPPRGWSAANAASRAIASASGQASGLRRQTWAKGRPRSASSASAAAKPTLLPAAKPPVSVVRD